MCVRAQLCKCVSDKVLLQLRVVGTPGHRPRSSRSVAARSCGAALADCPAAPCSADTTTGSDPVATSLACSLCSIQALKPVYVAYDRRRCVLCQLAGWMAGVCHHMQGLVQAASVADRLATQPNMCAAYCSGSTRSGYSTKREPAVGRSKQYDDMTCLASHHGDQQAQRAGRRAAACLQVVCSMALVQLPAACTAPHHRGLLLT
jgi:hypothetical protein